MKTVALWGDSIRLGYGPTVAAQLKDVAEFGWPESNCENSTRMLAHWKDWLGDTRPDVLHLNCGLHDVKTISPRTRELIVPLEFYRRNLELLFGELRFINRPLAKVTDNCDVSGAYALFQSLGEEKTPIGRGRKPRPLSESEQKSRSKRLMQEV